MKLDILSEKEIKLDAKSKKLLELIKEIRKNCSIFLDAEPSLIYRGIGSRKDFSLKDIRTDRRPSDTDKVFHMILDDIFMKIFGVRLRSSSLFATRDEETAATYGTLSIIFIPGEYTIISSNKINDLYDEFRNELLGGILPEFSKQTFRTFLSKLINDKEKYTDVIYDFENRFTANEFSSIAKINSLVHNMRVTRGIHKYFVDALYKYLYKYYDYESGTTIDNSELMILAKKYYYINLVYDYFGENVNRKIKNMSPREALNYLETYILKGKSFK